MPKVADAGEDHGEAVLVAGVDRVLIAHGAAGLDDCPDAGAGGFVDIVPKREEGVGGQDGSGNAVACFSNREVDGIDAAHLPGADAHEHPVLGEHDGVTFDMFAHAPGKAQVVQLFVGWRALRDCAELIEVAGKLVARLHQ